MTSFIVEGLMGSGKTLFTTIYTMRNINNYNKIIANYHIFHPKVSFSKMPLPEIHDENVLLIYDDILTADKQTLGIITSIIASLSRKKSFDLFLSTQRSVAVVDKTTRLLSYIIFPEYNRKLDFLRITIALEKDNETYQILGTEVYETNCRQYFKFYKTEEITVPIGINEIIESLLKLSKESQDYYLKIIANKSKKFINLFNKIMGGE